MRNIGEESLRKAFESQLKNLSWSKQQKLRHQWERAQAKEPAGTPSLTHHMRRRPDAQDKKHILELFKAGWGVREIGTALDLLPRIVESVLD
jgi:hypothetical protein